MNGKIKLGAIVVVSIAVLLGVFVAGFWYASYYTRYASIDFDVGLHSFHIQVWVERADGTTELIKDGVLINNAGVLTTTGKNWIEDQLGDSPSTDPAKWISLSTNSTSPSVAWTQIPQEIVSGGLERAAGTYASTGDGNWTISYQFTASDTHTDVRLTGLQWASSGDNNLLASDTFTPVTLNSGDKLTITWTCSVS